MSGVNRRVAGLLPNLSTLSYELRDTAVATVKEVNVFTISPLLSYLILLININQSSSLAKYKHDEGKM